MSSGPPPADSTAAPATPAAVEPQRLRSGLATFPTGVTVVTVGGEDPHGMTANAFTSVSLEPPLVLICVRHQARMHRALQRAGTFGLSVLAEDQEGIARYFASDRRPPGRAQFTGVPWSPGPRTGVPLIDGALAWLECTRWQVYEGGDHSIFVGRLMSVARQDYGEPLIFHNGRFCRLAGEVPDDSGPRRGPRTNHR